MGLLVESEKSFRYRMAYVIGRYPHEDLDQLRQLAETYGLRQLVLGEQEAYFGVFEIPEGPKTHSLANLAKWIPRDLANPLYQSIPLKGGP